MILGTVGTRLCALPAACLVLALNVCVAQDQPGVKKDATPPGLTLQPARTLAYSTDEGTWMSLDVSPDGNTLVFDLVGHLYTLPMQGGTAKPITSGLSYDSEPRFSPDGRHIVYVSDRSGATNLWIVNADGSSPRALTNDENTGFVSPTWTADGRFIVVSRKKPEFYDSAYELWMFDIEGGAGVQVTRSKASADAPPPSWHNALGGAASPDGRYFYYATKSGYFSDDIKFPLWQIARRDRTTGEEDLITSNQGSAMRPVLSHNGAELVYGTRRDDQTGLRIRDLTNGTDRWLKYPVQHDDQESYFSSRDLLPGYAFTPDEKSVIAAWGGKIHRIEVATGADQLIPFQAQISRELGPKLDFPGRVEEGPVKARIIQGAVESPDGNKVAFSSLTHLYVAPLPDGAPKRTTNANDAEYEPTWSPDGKWIAYVTWTNEEGALWKVAAAGGTPVRLTSTPAYYCSPAWSPDGSRIVALRSPRQMAMDQPDQWGRPIAGLELVSVPVEGGPLDTIAFAADLSFPHFAGGNDRVYATQTQRHSPLNADYALVSMRLDGTDKRTELKLKGKEIWGADFSPPIQIVVSPDRQQALALYRGQLYVFDLPRTGGETQTIDLSAPSVAIRRLTDVGADFASWTADSKTITWSLGARLF